MCAAVSDLEREKRARVAAQKKSRGEALKQVEQRDLDWWTGQQRRKLGEEFLVAVPKGIYCRYAGRQQKVVDDHGRLYGLPVLESAVNLKDVVAAVHSFLAANASKLAAAGSGDDLKRAKLSQQVEKLQREINLLDHELAERRQEFISRKELATKLGWLVSQLQQLGERAQQKFGADCGRLFNDELAKWRQSLELEQRGENEDQSGNTSDAGRAKSRSKKPKANQRRGS